MENHGGGCKSRDYVSPRNLILAIDFGKRNLTAGSSSFGGHCLHAVNQGDQNPYIISTGMICTVVAGLSSRPGRSVLLGFGAGNQPSVFSFRSPTTSPRCELEAALRRYEQLAPGVELGDSSSSSSYAPVIDAAVEIVRQDGFHVLIILTCGVGIDMGAQAGKTISALKRASKYPLSIVFAVVGDGPCTGLHKLRERLGMEEDSVEAKTALTNITIVDFQEHFSKPYTLEEKQIRFASDCLHALRDQYQSFRNRGILNCHQRTSSRWIPTEIPPCSVVAGGDSSGGGGGSRPYSYRATAPRASSSSSSNDYPSTGEGGNGYSSLPRRQRPNAANGSGASMGRAYGGGGMSRSAGAGPLVTDDRSSLGSPSRSGVAAVSTDEEEETCVICFSNPATAEFWGCRHRTCDSCAQKIRSMSEKGKMLCPFCRERVDGWKRMAI